VVRMEHAALDAGHQRVSVERRPLRASPPVQGVALQASVSRDERSWSRSASDDLRMRVARVIARGHEHPRTSDGHDWREVEAVRREREADDRLARLLALELDEETGAPEDHVLAQVVVENEHAR